MNDTIKNYNTNGLEITDVIIFPVKNRKNDKIKVSAFVKIVFNDMFVISGLKVIEGENGPFINYPTTPKTDGRKFDICYPTTPEVRKYISDQILEQYKLTMAEYEKMGR